MAKTVEETNFERKRVAVYEKKHRRNQNIA